SVWFSQTIDPVLEDRTTHCCGGRELRAAIRGERRIGMVAGVSVVLSGTPSCRVRRPFRPGWGSISACCYREPVDPRSVRLMPTTRRRRLASSLLVSFASLLLLAGCVGQRDPDSWGDSTKESFVEACDGTAAKDEPVDEIRSDLEDAALPTEDCECIVDHLEENMEFSEFKDANSKRREDEDGAAPLTGGGFDEA